MLYMVCGLLLSVGGVTCQLAAAELYLYAGAGLRKPMDQIIAQFERDSGHRVVVSYDGSGKLLARYLATRKGDLFMPGSRFYLEKLERQGLVVSGMDVVYHTPVVAVHRQGKNPIDRFEDLARPGLRLALGDPQAMAFGRTTLEILERSGLKEKILANVVVYGATVNQLTLYVVKRTVDGAVIGRSNAVMHPESLRIIPVPEAFCTPEIVAIAVLTTALNPQLARQFQQFAAGPAGIECFRRNGFLPIEHR